MSLTPAAIDAILADLAAVNAFGRAVFHARQGHAWSQRELAARAGVSPDTVRMVEAGGMWPRLDTVFRLLLALGTDLSTLVPLGTE